MGKTFYDVERAVDRRRQVKRIEDKVINLTEKQNKDGFTTEQLFLIEYYGLTEEELEGQDFGFSNIESITEEKSPELIEDLEIIRYTEMLDMFSKIEEFDAPKIDGFSDDFHKYITKWSDFSEGIEEDSLIVQKMRNLQMLNKIAHKYQTLFKNILYGKNPQISGYEEREKRRIECWVEDLFSKAYFYQEEMLEKRFGSEKVQQWKNDKAMKYCVQASRWMFSQKDKYLEEVLKGVQNSTGEYSYGVLNDGFIFDVPGYGQFGVHMGKNNAQKIQEFQERYNVGEYEGIYLGNVYILSKADPELLEDVDYEELSPRDKQRYRIASQKVQEPQKSSVQEDEPTEVKSVSELTETNEEKENQNASTSYKQIQDTTKNIVMTKQNIKNVKAIIKELKESKKGLKDRIQQIETEINEKILGNSEPTDEIIQDIKSLRDTVKQLKDMRKEVKQMQKRYKENKKNMKATLKQEMAERDVELGDLEL